ncbi:helix-turn-helix domain-containing protein [Streptomyces mirabilis]|uniref:helix-turn-helix domain-containing protein n=1 Tax=Streptomyces mirabilis TaxID=68239 RepID=UPI00143E564A|nr:helix-turn-helix transcriptional regulator [Streptomyces sp. S1D4-11]QIY99428.1 helix-turn-helix transcriptional regulator [Streptomyces sp. S1D4-11]
MRSKDDPTNPEQGTPAQRFGAFMTKAAMAAGFDVTPNEGGRQRLAETTGMSASAIGRMLDGKTLPLPRNFPKLARAVNVPVRRLFEIADMEMGEDSIDERIRPVGSVPLTPQEVADMWGLTDPALRQLFIANSEQVRRLQLEKNQSDSDGGAVARG